MSGVLFLLPALSKSRMSRLGKAVWIFQAFISILADYFMVGIVSHAHGIDRYWAVLNCFRVLYVGFNAKLWRHVAMAPIPLGIHLLARIAKQEEVSARSKATTHQKMLVVLQQRYL